MPQVVAVILTYNRKELLQRTLNAVYAQTRPCDRVIVVDNASHDGTRQFLLAADYPNLEVYVLSENIGASGGFNTGFRLAYQSGADFIWMMDDDIIAEPDALQHLLAADELLERQGTEHAFLISTAYTENGFITNTPGLSSLPNQIGYRNWPAWVAHGMAPVQRATFVSILVPRSILAEHGLPIASMFIWGEDTEFTLRITRDKPGFIVGASKVVHLRQESGPISILTEHNPVRLKFHRHRIRNDIFIARKYKSFGAALLEAYKNAALLFSFLCKARFDKARIIFYGLIESLWFFPDIEAVNAPFTMKVSIKKLRRLATSDIEIVPGSDLGMRETADRAIAPASPPVPPPFHR